MLGRRLKWWIVVVLATVENFGRSDGPMADDFRIPPISLEEAQDRFRLHDGFRIDLLAAEPMVTDPTAIVHDEDGRAFVCEMNDYPYTDKSTDKPFVERTADEPIGQIRMLLDDNGDGRFDRSQVFADRLSWPTGLVVWRGGLFVTATPDVWYLKDMDGDGKADVRRKVLGGFRKFNVQAVMNNPRWGLDHKIYVAGGTNGGRIVRENNPAAAPIVMTASDFVLDPLTETFQLETGGSRFGQTTDDWGRRFICNIRNPVQQIVLPARYLARNPNAGTRTAIHDAALSGEAIPVFRRSDPEPWRLENARRLASDPAGFSPRSETMATGYMTSACGITIYRGSAYPPEFYGNLFLAEPSGNLVHRQLLSSADTTFRSTRADHDTEFLSSTDQWFRPVNFYNAPDGTLHLLDMYRETIEHPWSIPDDIKERLDLQSGRDRGRIYRIAPVGFQPGPTPRLSHADNVELVAQLSNPNSWWRETAHRLIFERQDPSMAPLLRTALKHRETNGSSPDSSALSRVHALWSLEGLNALTKDDLLVALADPVAGVRENAVRVAEGRLLEQVRIQAAVATLAEDSDPHVRFQVVLSLGGIESPSADSARLTIANRDGADPWVRAALLCSTPQAVLNLGTNLLELASRLDRVNGLQNQSTLLLLREIAAVVGSENNDDRIRKVVHALASANTSEPLSATVLVGLAEGLARRGLFLDDRIPTDSDEGDLLRRILSRASTVAGDAAEPVESRVDAVALLAFSRSGQLSQRCRDLLQGHQPSQLQSAAIRAIATGRPDDSAEILIAAYPSLGPVSRSQAMETLLSRPEWCRPLVEAMEQKVIKTWDVPRSRRVPLLRHSDSEVRSRAIAVFSQDAIGPRREVLERYREALAMPSDSKRGAEVYRKSCQGCHRRGDGGHDVGPSLDSVRHRGKEELLLAILDPNREVAPEFLEYTVQLSDGRTIAGMIGSQTAASITLRRAEGVDETILRDQIEQWMGAGRSLMPEGLEQQIDPQQMADLLAFLLEKH